MVHFYIISTESFPELCKNDFREFHFRSNLICYVRHEDETYTSMCHNLPKDWNESQLCTKIRVELTIGMALKSRAKIKKKRFFAKKTFFFDFLPYTSSLKKQSQTFAQVICKIQTIGHPPFARILDMHACIKSYSYCNIWSFRKKTKICWVRFLKTTARPALARARKYCTRGYVQSTAYAHRK